MSSKALKSPKQEMEEFIVLQKSKNKKASKKNKIF